MEKERNAKGNQGWGISAAALKRIGLGAMIIDHMGVVIWGSRFAQGISWSSLPENRQLLAWLIFRGIGRMAFPLYCFLLVEGFRRTGNLGRYIRRMGLMALLSEIPYDLVSEGVPFYFGDQNVFFTLTLTLAALYFVSRCQGAKNSREIYKNILLVILCTLATLVLHSDYGFWGPMLAVSFYLADQPRLMNFILPLLFLTEDWGLVAVPGLLAASWLISRYNGRRGHMAYPMAYYSLYPAHLLVLYLLAPGLRGLAIWLFSS